MTSSGSALFVMNQVVALTGVRRASQLAWAGMRERSGQVQSVVSGGVRHVNPALALTASRRCHNHHSWGLYHPAIRLLHRGRFLASVEAAQSRQRWNMSRIYARRMIELAAASAAARRSVAEMEERGGVVDVVASKPDEWGRVARGEVPSPEQRAQEFARGAGLAKTKLARIWAAGRRIAALSILASPFLVLTPLAWMGGPKSRFEEMAWEYALWSVETAGPTFTKLAQWATTRTDLFPAEFVSRFSKLQDSTIGHGWKVTEKALCDAFGEDYHNVVAIDAMEPIGSGCIAQVYKAKLVADTPLIPAGTEIALKVQHPNIRRKVFVDFYIASKIAGLVESIPYLNLDYLSIQDSVEQFRAIMVPQLDMRIEARNLTRFLKDFSDDDTVTFPMPLHDLTTRDVLVETFMHGEPILNYTQPGRLREDKKELATMGLSMAMRMIFLHDHVHGDLHPGNILVEKINNGKQLRLNVIDCGLVVEMGEQDHKNLVMILGAFVKRDGILAGSLMVDTAKKCQASPLDVSLFCDGIERICADDEENNFLEKVGDYMADICYLACKHKVKLEACFMNAALACEIMEGIATSLYPDMRVQQIALPMVFKAEMMHGMKKIKAPSLF